MPEIVILAGPNGAGKSTVASSLWRVYDNTQPSEPSLVAKGILRVQQAVLWGQIKKD